MSYRFDDSIIEDIITKFKSKIEKTSEKENICYEYFEHLLAQIKFAQGDNKHLMNIAKSAYEKIAQEANVEIADGYYSMALFYAMRSAENDNKYKNFSRNFRFAIKYMLSVEKVVDHYGPVLKRLLEVYRNSKEIVSLINKNMKYMPSVEKVMAHYGQLLKRLLKVYRNSKEVVLLVDKTMKFIDGDRECFGNYLDEFIKNLQLYKLAALSHLGKIEQSNKIAEEYFSDIKTAENLELYLIYMNRRIVNLQDVFDYKESLKLGNEVEKVLKFNEKTGTNFIKYQAQYFRICGSMALTCYFTFNKSLENLNLARRFSDIAINGFTRNDDEKRAYQVRAQIEAEAGEFETACKMLNKGINITIKNPTAEQFKKLSEFDWYHFAKIVERLLKSNVEEYFEIAKNAIEISRQEFLNYRNKIGDTPKHPNYITFSKMGTCFDILGEVSLSLQLHDAALRGVDSDSGDDTAAFRLVIWANKLLTLEKNNFVEESVELRNTIKNHLAEYFNKVNIESMKEPFEGWSEAFEHIEKNSADKITILEKMSRAILL